MVNRYGVIFEYGMSDFYHNRIIRHIEGTHREQTFPYTLPETGTMPMHLNVLRMIRQVNLSRYLGKADILCETMILLVLLW